MIESNVALKPVANPEGLSKVNAGRKQGFHPENGKPEQEEQRCCSKEELQAAVDSTNKLLFKNNITNLKFELHEGTGKMMVKVVDTSTDEVIKEIPSEKLLDYEAGMEKLVGKIINERA
jgi:flagellar protein FlaG